MGKPSELLPLALVLVALFMLGCTAGQEQTKTEIQQAPFVGDKIAINVLISNPDGSQTGIKQVDENNFEVNPEESSEQRITITLGNRSYDSIYFKNTDFSCNGKNEGQPNDATFDLKDIFFECVNCPDKKTCKFYDTESDYDQDSNCFFDKGSKPLAIEKGQGINLVATVTTSENLNGTATCTLKVETFVEDTQKVFKIHYLGK